MKYNCESRIRGYVKEVNAKLINMIFIKHIMFRFLKLDVTFLVYISLQIPRFVRFCCCSITLEKSALISHEMIYDIQSAHIKLHICIYCCSGFCFCSGYAEN